MNRGFLKTLFIIIVTIIVTLFVIGSLVKKTGDNIKNEFVTKCNNGADVVNQKITQIENEINAKAKPLGVNVDIALEKVFFSNKKNACLVAYSVTTDVNKNTEALAQLFGHPIKSNVFYDVRNVFSTDNVVFHAETKDALNTWISQNQ